MNLSNPKSFGNEGPCFGTKDPHIEHLNENCLQVNVYLGASLISETSCRLPKDTGCMKKTNLDKFFFSFAILAVISGIYLIIQGDYITGFFGSISGLFLIYLQKVNNKTGESKE